MDDFWTAKDLARDLGYPSANREFWRWVKRVGLKPIPDSPYAFRVSDVRKKIRLS